MAVVSYKCPNCGGDLRFDPKTQKYKCEYCLSEFTEEVLHQQEEKESSGQQSAEQESRDGLVYSCPSCGAQIITDETTAATFCYYCHNPVVLEGKLSGDYKPDQIIPFKVDKKEAVSHFLAYMKKKKFVPKAFFNKDQIEKISGVYFPFWMFECDVMGHMDATATNVRIYRIGDTEFTETRFYNVQREGGLHFEELTKNALNKANRKLVEGVQPFMLNDLQKFSMGYLSGFQAEKRDMEKRDFEDEVRREISDYSKSILKDSISGYTTVKSSNLALDTPSEHWKYILLPVWVLTYKGKDDKMYYYAMNGQTKNICGELPIDYKKVALMFAAIAIPVFLLLLLGGYFIW
ncbi:TFIIB-type zinc ribbon-containing protein [uncultured Robinsoniella sp.]|uniref:TFIIB-type zinc ribbon-containing protein n=1 Tax=uncultured Robinsoniella sp. TaxID=904190 RepID=UPI00374F50EF